MQLDQSLQKITVVTETINELIHRHEKGKDLSVRAIKKFMSEIAKKIGLSSIPKLVDLVSAVPESYKAKLLPVLKTKPVRTASGIAVVAVMCKPHRCPHIATTGNICIYCPGGPDSDFEYST